MIHYKKRKTGISDVLATVIIVAATVAIALVAIAYFTGLVGGATHTQKIQTVGNPQLLIRGTNAYFIVHLKNSGDSQATLSYIQIKGHYAELDNSTSGATVYLSGDYTTDNNYPAIPPGGIMTMNVTLVGVSDIYDGVTYHYEIGVTGGSTVAGDVVAVQEG